MRFHTGLRMKLAERTTHSTADIAATIGEIQAAAGEAVRTMDQAQDEVASGIGMLRESVAGLAGITTASPQVAAMASHLSEASRQQGAASEEAELDAMRVLLAEDHPTNRRVVELILGAAGVDLISVENGAEAVDEAARGSFDLIRRREARAGRRTPIFTLTANAMPEHAEASARAGADGHVTKPITAERLLHVVEQVWAEKAARVAQDTNVVALRA